MARAVLISSVPPLMVKTDANPGGLPKSVFDDLQAQLAASRTEFYRALPSGPFYGYNRPGATPSEAIIANWWRQGMCPQKDSNLRTWLRRPVLYPLSYGGSVTQKGYQSAAAVVTCAPRVLVRLSPP